MYVVLQLFLKPHNIKTFNYYYGLISSTGYIRRLW